MERQQQLSKRYKDRLQCDYQLIEPASLVLLLDTDWLQQGTNQNSRSTQIQIFVYLLDIILLYFRRVLPCGMSVEPVYYNAITRFCLCATLKLYVTLRLIIYAAIRAC